VDTKREALGLLNPNTGIRAKTIKDRIWWDVIQIGIAFISVIILAAIVYRVGTPKGWGIEPTFDTRDRPSLDFWDCVYFSTVTITTLGYGDLRPVSWGRVVSGFEVTIGIVLMGVLVSRLVSRQQDRLLKRVMRGQINTEIQGFRRQILVLVKKLELSSKTTALNSSQRLVLLDRCAGLLKSIARYWRYENKSDDFYEVAQTRGIGRFLGEQWTLLELVSQMVEGETSKTLDEPSRIKIRNIAESILSIAKSIEHKEGPESLQKDVINKVYSRVAELREKFELKRSLRPKGAV
jgi:hypothetical protein